MGTGRLTVGLNATINNTSGTALIASTNNLQTWNGDFTFTGTNDLNLGTGAVTVNANASNTTGGRGNNYRQREYVNCGRARSLLRAALIKLGRALSP